MIVLLLFYKNFIISYILNLYVPYLKFEQIKFGTNHLTKNVKITITKSKRSMNRHRVRAKWRHRYINVCLWRLFYFKAVTAWRSMMEV